MLGVEPDAQDTGQQNSAGFHLGLGVEALRHGHKAVPGLLDHDRLVIDLDLGDPLVVEVALGRAPAQGLGKELDQRLVIVGHARQRAAALALLLDSRSEHHEHLGVALGRRRERVQELGPLAKRRREHVAHGLQDGGISRRLLARKGLRSVPHNRR